MAEKLSIGVQKEFCDECALGLRRFIGHMKGVEEVEVREGKIVISYDGSKIAEADLMKLSKDTVEKLGYKLAE
ncbi:MAG: hypothetical protein Kow0025_05300 [Thermodesulfovibrionales bacterium]